MIRRHQWFTTTVLCSALASFACGATHEAFTDPAKAGPDFKIQGEYQGELKLDGKITRAAVQVIAKGQSEFDAVLYVGGLPGDGWKRGDKRENASGKTVEKVTKLTGPAWTAEVGDDQLSVTNSAGEKLGTLKKVERHSPTLGFAPPEGAKVLFDGKNTDHFPGAKMTDDHLLMVPAMGKEEFKDFNLHVEFRTPFMPTARGQGRGNSGVYLQNRYEVQVLDSFGLEGANNECGGVYSIKEPAVNMCFPPLSWQTYDIDFTAARFDGKKKTHNARVTIEHNGVKIYDNFEIPDKTPGGADSEAPGVGPFALQFHGNPVVFRNIWVLEKK